MALFVCLPPKVRPPPARYPGQPGPGNETADHCDEEQLQIRTAKKHGATQQTPMPCQISPSSPPVKACLFHSEAAPDHLHRVISKQPWFIPVSRVFHFVNHRVRQHHTGK